MEQIDRENFHPMLDGFAKENGLSLRRVAAAMSCSDATVTRLAMGATLPTDAALREGAILFALGLERYAQLSRAEREKISEALATAGAGAVGFASISAAVGSLGLAGLSAAGISSGLASLGALIGGGMVAGVSVAAALPVAAAGVGYSLVRGVKGVAQRRQLNQKNVDPRWETVRES